MPNVKELISPHIYHICTKKNIHKKYNNISKNPTSKKKTESGPTFEKKPDPDLTLKKNLMQFTFYFFFDIRVNIIDTSILYYHWSISAARKVKF